MEAAKHLKPCILELGGKAPTIVCYSDCFLFSHTDESAGLG